MNEHERMSEQLKNCMSPSKHMELAALTTYVEPTVRFSIKDLDKDFSKTEDDIKAVQSVGQIIGEVLKQLDDERCTSVIPLDRTAG